MHRDATLTYVEAEKASSTRQAFAADWRDFAIWCHARAATPLPAHPGIVAAYLSALADRGRKSSTIGRRAASIARATGGIPYQSTSGVTPEVHRQATVCELMRWSFSPAGPASSWRATRKGASRHRARAACPSTMTALPQFASWSGAIPNMAVN
jgi:hypothetical protein